MEEAGTGCSVLVLLSPLVLCGVCAGVTLCARNSYYSCVHWCDTRAHNIDVANLNDFELGDEECK